MKIYVASSYRSEYVARVISELRTHGHEVYDFKHPWGADRGFEWSAIDPNWQDWNSREFVDALKSHPHAIEGFERDRDAILWADVLVLVCPCGTSAHSEFGFAAGKGKKTAILLMEPSEPELMYGFADFVTDDIRQLLLWLGQLLFTQASRRVPESKL